MRGEIIDASGNRVWDADVSITNTNYSFTGNADTDWEGKYKFDNFPPGNVNITISKNGYTNRYFNSVPISAGSNVYNMTMDFDFTNYGTIWGKVRDSNGVLQPGIRVRTTGTYESYFYTNKFGEYAATSLPNATYDVEVYSFTENSTPETGIVVNVGDVIGNVDFTVDLVLGTISGQVTNADSKPIVDDLSVYVYPYNTSFYPTYTYYGDDGDYTACGIRPEYYTSYASADGYVDRYYDGALDIYEATLIEMPDSGGEVSGIDIMLPTGEVVSGKVYDRFLHPIYNQRVYISNQDITYQTNTRTNTFGYYEFISLPAGNYKMWTQRNNYYQEYYENKFTEAAAAVIELVTGVPKTGYNFVIGLGGSIAGEVKNETGTLYTSGTVYAYYSGDTTNYIANTSINASGEYLIEHLRPGTYYVRANANGVNVYYNNAYSLGSASQVTVVDEAVTNNIDFVIPEIIERGSISGTITNQDGSPFASTSVYGKGVDGTSANSNGYTNSSGEYTMSNIQPGSYVVYVSETDIPNYYYGGTYDENAATRVEITPGLDVTNIDIQTADKHYSNVYGTVENVTGDPIDNATVYLNATNSSYNTTTGPDGAFAFTDVFPSDSYSIQAQKTGYYTTINSLIVPPDSDVTGVVVTLTDYNGGNIAGTVKDASGNFLPDAYLDITMSFSILQYICLQ